MSNQDIIVVLQSFLIIFFYILYINEKNNNIGIKEHLNFILSSIKFMRIDLKRGGQNITLEHKINYLNAIANKIENNLKKDIDLL